MQWSFFFRFFWIFGCILFGDLGMQKLLALGHQQKCTFHEKRQSARMHSNLVIYYSLGWPPTTTTTRRPPPTTIYIKTNCLWMQTTGLECKRRAINANVRKPQPQMKTTGYERNRLPIGENDHPWMETTTHRWIRQPPDGNDPPQLAGNAGATSLTATWQPEWWMTFVVRCCWC